jgi:hypothetical protein
MAGLPIVGKDIPDPSVSQTAHQPKPPWLRVKAPGGGKTGELRALLADESAYEIATFSNAASAPAAYSSQLEQAWAA